MIRGREGDTEDVTKKKWRQYLWKRFGAELGMSFVILSLLRISARNTKNAHETKDFFAHGLRALSLFTQGVSNQDAMFYHFSDIAEYMLHSEEAARVLRAMLHQNIDHARVAGEMHSHVVTQIITRIKTQGRHVAAHPSLPPQSLTPTPSPHFLSQNNCFGWNEFHLLPRTFLGNLDPES